MDIKSVFKLFDNFYDLTGPFLNYIKPLFISFIVFGDIFRDGLTPSCVIFFWKESIILWLVDLSQSEGVNFQNLTKYRIVPNPFYCCLNAGYKKSK